MVQATTPTFVMTLPGSVDPGDFAHMYFSLVQNTVNIRKDDADITVDGQTVSATLSQADTVRLIPGDAKIQLNWTYPNGSRACSQIVVIHITENLLKEVVE